MEFHHARHETVLRTFYGICRVFLRQLTGAILGDRRRAVHMKTFNTLLTHMHFEITAADDARANTTQFHYQFDLDGHPNWINNDDDDSTEDDSFMVTSDESDTLEGGM
jgi:hypothetical protein